MRILIVLKEISLPWSDEPTVLGAFEKLKEWTVEILAVQNTDRLSVEVQGPKAQNLADFFQPSK